MHFELFTKGDHAFPLVTKDNEAGVKALTTPNADGRGFYAEQALDGLITLTAEEARTIYFALLSQRDAFYTDLQSHMDDEQNYEDATFVAHELAKVLQLLYTMCDDHEAEYKKVVGAWLAV